MNNEDDDALMEEAIARTMRTMPFFDRIRRQHKGRNWQGVVECPECKGKLHASHSAYNGHIHAQCETENCISFME